MRVRCPKCDETFPAKANANRIKCPGCGWREAAPEGGFGAAWASGKPRTEFRPMESAVASAGTTTDPRLVWGAIIVVALLAVAGWWLFMRGGESATNDGPGNVAGEGACSGITRAGLSLESPGNDVAALDTDKGCIVIELYNDKTPITTANFRTYASEQFFDGTLFHRIARGFMIQGGGMDTNGQFREPTHPMIHNEARESGLLNAKYTIAMARLGPEPNCSTCPDRPDSATNQFFINHADNANLDPSPSSAGYAVFGKVVQGQDVVEAIATVPVAPMKQGSHCQDDNCPVQDVVIRTVRILGATSGTTTLPAQAESSCVSLDNGAPPAPAAVHVDLITPGVWNVCSNTESQYVWVHNNGTAPLDYTWSLTGAGGAALPAGWTATFVTPSGTLAEAGAKEGAWAATVVKLTIPASQPAGQIQAELHAGGATRPFVFHVAEERGRVTVSGEHVQTHYDLDDDRGTAIQHNGDFCVTLGPGTNAVQGYAWGLIGLAKGETVTLVVPPPFAYHYSGHSLSAKTLVWKATINGYSTTPPDQQTAQCPGAA